VETLDNKTIIQSHLCLPSLRRLTPLGGWGILKFKKGPHKMGLRLPNDIPDDDRHAAWIRVVERICEEHHHQGWNHYMFRLLRAVFDNDDRLSNEGGFIFNWIVEIYVDSALMLLRRELDHQAHTENLRNLLSDIIEHPSVLTRARYRAAWGDQEDFGNRAQANRVFDSFKPRRVEGNPDADYIDPAVVGEDLAQVDRDAEELRTYAERTRAHRTPKPKVDIPDVTFHALHKAISDVRDIVAKYYAILTLASIGRWEPLPLYDTIGPFMRAWVENPRAVDDAVTEGGEAAEAGEID